MSGANLKNKLTGFTNIGRNNKTEKKLVICVVYFDQSLVAGHQVSANQGSARSLVV